MRTRSAAQTPRIPQSASSAASEHGGARDERGDHRHREERPVARADQDPVEREHRSVQRLHEREDRPQERRLVEHGRVARERARQHAGEHEHERGEDAAERDREPDHPLARAVGLLPPPGAELAPDDDLPGDRDRVEDEREEDPELEGDLMRGDRGVAEPRRDGAGEDEGAASARSSG